MSEEQGYPAGNRGEKSEAIYEDFCKCYDLAMLASSYWPELPGSFGGTVSERLSVTLTAEHNAREAAEERGKALEADAQAAQERVRLELLRVDTLAQERGERSKALAETLREIDAMLDSFPAGVDEDADPDDESPEDAEAHTAGLIRQAIRAVLEQSK